MIAFYTLFKKEFLRFWKIALQTIMAPVVTALLYLMIFSQVLEGKVLVHGVPYTTFIVPGLIMMQVLQNAFANTSSSLIQAKITGSIVFVLLPPFSPIGFYSAYVAAAVLRGVLVGLGVLVATLPFTQITVAAPVWLLVFALLGGIFFATLGVIAGLWSEKFDHLATFQNFLIMPLTMLSGVFYSILSLPPLWQQLSKFNPVFYLIDGFRYGFFAASDTSPWISLSVISACLLPCAAATIYLLQKGWKLRG